MVVTMEYEHRKEERTVKDERNIIKLNEEEYNKLNDIFTRALKNSYFGEDYIDGFKGVANISLGKKGWRKMVDFDIEKT